MTKDRYRLHLVFLVAVALLIAFIVREEAFFYGLFVALINALIYYGLYQRHHKQVAKYPAQALVVVIISAVNRFVAVGGLLVLGLRYNALVPGPLILGFVLGQIFFLLNQFLMVKRDNGK